MYIILIPFGIIGLSKSGVNRGLTLKLLFLLPKTAEHVCSSLILGIKESTKTVIKPHKKNKEVKKIKAVKKLFEFEFLSINEAFEFWSPIICSLKVQIDKIM